MSHLVPTPSPVCSNNYVSLSNYSSIGYYTSRRETIGRLTACYNETYVDICADYLNITTLVTRACEDRGYYLYSGTRNIVRQEIRYLEYIDHSSFGALLVLIIAYKETMT